MVGTHLFSSGRILSFALLKTWVLLLLLAYPCCAEGSKGEQSASDPAGSDEAKLVAVSTVNPVTANPWVASGSGAPVDNSLGINAGSLPIEAVRKQKGVDWKSILLQSASFLAIEQGFRVGTQPGTREALKGKFFNDWFESVKATKGWGDGDDFLTNYIGHPMEGSVVDFIFVQNDPRGRNQIFNWSSSYWNSRLKAAAYSAIYSTQFELGPISEASIGNVGYYGGSLSGAVDLVVTPLAGLGWNVGEDVLDKYLVVKIESWTRNPVILMFARSVLNPTRSFANMMRLVPPWSRDTRAGIWVRP